MILFSAFCFEARISANPTALIEICTRVVSVNVRLDLFSLDILELPYHMRQWLRAALGSFEMLPYMDRQIFVHSVAEA
jgi:hypothetical protein